MRTIEVDIDVHKQLTVRRAADEVTYNDLMRAYSQWEASLPSAAAVIDHHGYYRNWLTVLGIPFSRQKLLAIIVSLRGCLPSKYFERSCPKVCYHPDQLADLYKTRPDFMVKFYQKDCFLHSDTID